MGYVLNAKHPNRDHVMQNIRDALARLPADKSFEISIEPFQPEMTDQQRKALFGVAYKTLMDHIGLSGAPAKQDLHRYFCMAYFGKITTSFEDFSIPCRTTTRDELGHKKPISIAEALDFYAFIQRKSADRGMYVPDPDPLWREKARLEAEREAKTRNA